MSRPEMGSPCDSPSSAQDDGARVAPSLVRDLCRRLTISPRSPSHASAAPRQLRGSSEQAPQARRDPAARGPHSPDPDLPQRIARGSPIRPKINDPIRRPRFPGQHPIEACPAFGRHFRFKPASNLQLRSRTELARDKVAGPRAQSRADIIPANDEVGAIVSPAPHKDMDMRMLGVPVVDGDPVEPRAEIARGLVHQLPSKAAQTR